MTDRLRITHVVNTGVFAGLERYVVDVSNVLDARGHDVAVIGGARTAMASLLAPGVHWQRGAEATVALRALRQGGRRDIVHSHIAKSDFVALAASSSTRAARVSTRHITARRGYGPVARRLAPLVRARLASEIAVSAWTSTQLERPADAVLLNGVATVPAVDVQRRPVVFVAQRLEPEKDTDIALRAWAASGLGRRGWRLVIAGRGDQRPRLEGLAVELGITEHVEFVGFLDDPGSYYRTASMLLAPAPTEPCGLTVLEAMAHALPVVAAGSAGHAETIGTLPGGAATFDPKDVAGAAAQLCRLAEDAEARTTYGHALREWQRDRFSLDVHVDALEAIYRKVMRGRR